MRVTIIADGSYCDVTKAGGYGFWVVSERGRHAGGGSLKGRTLSSADAEMKAVAKALHYALKHGIACGGDEVLIQTDCSDVLTRLERRRNPVERCVSDGLALIHKLETQHALHITYKHVKGHTGRRDPRFKAQWHCDRRAYAGMSELRKRRSETT